MKEMWCADDFVKMLLRGKCTPNQKLTCFELYLKIVNTFLKNHTASSIENCTKNSKIALKIN